MTAAIVNTDYVENIKVMDAVGFDYVIDGGGAAIPTGFKPQLRLPYAFSIDNVTATADQAGSVEIAPAYKATWDSDLLAASDYIAASSDNYIHIVTNSISSDTYPATWSPTSLAQGGALGFNVISVTTITRVTLHFRASKT
jgi:hypothetical protein